ncbi:MAG: YezD family protein [Verrucomicrobiota bacterium]
MNITGDVNGSQLSWIDLLKDQVGSLRYGTVQIVVHDRRVVQIERTEKFRFENGDTPKKSAD